MRLSSKQIAGIVLSLSPFINNQPAELCLYGSRVNDNLKGGDIDLLLLVEKSDLVTDLNVKKHYILSAIKKTIGDQRIDLLIIDKNKALDDNFIKMILPNSISLKTWK